MLCVVLHAGLVIAVKGLHIANVSHCQFIQLGLQFPAALIQFRTKPVIDLFRSLRKLYTLELLKTIRGFLLRIVKQCFVFISLGRDQVLIELCLPDQRQIKLLQLLNPFPGRHHPFMIRHEVFTIVPHLLCAHFTANDVIVHIRIGIRIIVLVQTVLFKHTVIPGLRGLTLLGVCLLQGTHQVLIKEQILDLPDPVITSRGLRPGKDIRFSFIDPVHGLKGLIICS